MMNMLKVIKSLLNGVYFAFPSIIISRYFRISHFLFTANFQIMSWLLTPASLQRCLSREPEQEKREMVPV